MILFVMDQGMALPNALKFATNINPCYNRTVTRTKKGPRGMGERVWQAAGQKKEENSSFNTA